MHLPQLVAQGLDQFVESARAAFGADLVSIVLYGSAAEGRLRATSDVNTITVVKSFSKSAAIAIAPAITLLATAMRLETMFVLESELDLAINAFPVKFADIRHRRRVLVGVDPFTNIVIPREVLIARLRQVLLNSVLRTRHSYALRINREDRMVNLVADLAGPLRSAASALLELNGAPAASPRAALEQVAKSSAETPWIEAVALLSDAREKRALPAGKTAAEVVFSLIELAQHMLGASHKVQP